MTSHVLREYIDIIEQALDEFMLDEFMSPTYDWRIKRQAEDLVKEFFKKPKLVPLLRSASHGERRAMTRVQEIAQKHLLKVNSASGYKTSSNELHQILDAMMHVLDKDFEHLQKHAHTDTDPEWVKQARAEHPQQSRNDFVRQLAGRYKVDPWKVAERVKEIAQHTGKSIDLVLAAFGKRVGVVPAYA